MKSCSPAPLWPSEQCYYPGWEAAAAGVPCPAINSLQHLESWLPYKLSLPTGWKIWLSSTKWFGLRSLEIRKRCCCAETHGAKDQKFARSPGSSKNFLHNLFQEDRSASPWNFAKAWLRRSFNLFSWLFHCMHVYLCEVFVWGIFVYVVVAV